MCLRHPSLGALEAGFGLRLGDRALLDQAASEDIASRRVFVDALVHVWLRVRRLIRFVMTKAAIADEVDQRVTMEPSSIFDGEMHGGNGRFDVIGVDVDNRDVEAFR